MNAAAFLDALYLGVDGGGTQTVAWLGRVSEDGQSAQVLGRGVGGPGNPQAIGFEAALSNVESAISLAFDDASVARQAATGACLCLAGVGREEERERVSRWAASNHIASQHRVISDTEAILAAAVDPRDTSGEFPAVALVAGTGSMAWGRSTTGDTARSGGWGYLIGDEGSGYAIAIEALRLACQTVDGRRSEHQLLDALLAATQCRRAQDLIDWTYGPQASRRRIAELAKVVFEQAATGAATDQIIDRAADQLAELVQSVAGALQLKQHGYLLALAGGVLGKQPGYVQRLKQKLALRHSAAKEYHLVEHPVSGALRLATTLRQ